MRKQTASRYLCVAAIAAASLSILWGCATVPAQSSQARKIPDDLSFHRSLKMEEYIRPFAQEEYPMPESAEALLQLIPFATAQPAGKNRTLVMVTLRIRDLRPQDAQAGKMDCVKDGMLTVKAAPGFTLAHLHGAPHPETKDGVITVKLGGMKPGERRVYVAELDAHQEPGRQRLLGATFQCARPTDGYLFETLEGVQQEWQVPTANPMLNKWAARNSLILADAAALIEIGKWAEKGDAENLNRALGLVDLQLNSIGILESLDPVGLGRERERFQEVRVRLGDRLKSASTTAVVVPAGKVQTASGISAGQDQTAHADAQGAFLATDSPTGPWTTLADLLVIPLP